MSISGVLGHRCLGVVKSFSPAAGWGFITPDDFSEDVFVSFRTCPNLKGSDFVGQRVSFIPAENSNKPGSFEATICELVDAVDENASLGKFVDAKVKSWNPDAGWGFVTSVRVPRDIFISKKLCPALRTYNPPKGSIVRVKVGESKSNSGSFEASELELKDNDTGMGGMSMGMGGMGMGGMSPQDMKALAIGHALMQLKGGGKESGKGGGKGGGKSSLLNILSGSMGGGLRSTPYGNAAPTPKATAPKASQSGRQSIGHTVSGVIKSFVADNKYGFVTCEWFEDDCFFNIKGNPHLSQHVAQLQKGMPVSFTVQESATRPGALEAVDINM